MSYVALARKLRPQTFDELSGQEFVVTTLKNSIEMGRIVHAYLFTGPRGVGKTSAARILAKAVNCLEPDGCNPCNKCENCLEITSGTSIDVSEIDGASNRGIDEIRELREAVRFLPMKCKYKVYIIDEVHMLTDAAFNALLKTLEEPPEYVIFIMATTDPHKIPATIISRCQKYDFNKIPYDVMYNSLASAMDNDNIPYDTDALSLVVRNSDGCMRDSLSLLDQIIAFAGGKLDEQNTNFLLGYSDKSIVNNLFEAVIRENQEDIMTACESLNAKGISHSFAVKTLIEHTRNLLMRLVTKKDSHELTAKENSFYAEMAKLTSQNKLFALFQVFQKLLNDIKFFSFEQYVFEFGMYKAASLSSLISTGGMTPQTPPATSQPSAQKAEDTVQKPVIQKPHADVSDKPVFSSTDIQLNAIVKALEESNCPSFASNLGFGYIIQMSGSTLHIGFSADHKFHYEYFNRNQNLKAMSDAVAKKFPEIKDVHLVLETDSKKKSIVEKKESIETYHNLQLRKEAEQDPIVNMLLMEFNGKFADVSILQKPVFIENEEDEPEPDL